MAGEKVEVTQAPDGSLYGSLPPCGSTRTSDDPLGGQPA